MAESPGDIRENLSSNGAETATGTKLGTVCENNMFWQKIFDPLASLKEKIFFPTSVMCPLANNYALHMLR